MSGGADFIKPALQLGGTIGSALIGGQSAERAAEQQIQGLQQGQQVSQQAVGQARRDILGTAQPGLEDLIAGFQGAISVLDQPFTTGQEFADTPGQQFLRDEQEQALLRNASALGGIGGGRVRQQLQQNAFGRAAGLQGQERGFEQQQRANIANLLSSGGGQTAQFRGGLGTNLANISLGGAAQQIPLITGTGAAQAAGTLGQGSALQQGFGGIGRTLGGIF